MSIFARKENQDFEEEEILSSRRKSLKGKNFKDLKPENRKKRKESPKPWGKKERYLVLFVLAFTVIASGVLSLSAREWKLPGLPRIKISAPSLFKNETIVIEADKTKKLEAEKKKAEKTISAFKEQTKNLSGVYGFYVIDLKTDYSFGLYESEIFQAASLIKLPVMAAIYQEAEKGAIKLDSRSGSERTYRQLIEAMGKRSDNNAQIKAVSLLGQEKIENVISEIGMAKTSLPENETTPEDIGLFFKKLYQGEFVSGKNKEEFLGFLTDTIYEEWLTAGLPDSIRFSHKYGREIHVLNDAGIVFSEKPFILVVMSKGVIEKEADEVFPKLSKIVFENR